MFLNHCMFLSQAEVQSDPTIEENEELVTTLDLVAQVKPLFVA